MVDEQKPPKDYIGKVYGNLKAAYGDQVTINEYAFRFRMLTEEDYRKKVYGNLKEYYKEDVSIDEAAFTERVKKNPSETSFGSFEQKSQEQLRQESTTQQREEGQAREFITRISAPEELHENPLQSLKKGVVGLFKDVLPQSFFQARAAGTRVEPYTEKDLSDHEALGDAANFLFRKKISEGDYIGALGVGTNEAREYIKEQIGKPEEYVKGQMEEKLRLLAEADREAAELEEYTKDVPKSIGQINDPADLAGYLAYNVGQTIPQAGISFATGGMSGYLQEFGEVYDKQLQKLAKDNDTTVDEVIKQGWDDPVAGQAAAMLSASLDRVGVEALIKNFGKNAIKDIIRSSSKIAAAKKIGLSAIQTGLIEADTEGIQYEANEIGSSIAAGRRLNQAFKDLDSKQFTEAFFAGLGTGALLAGAGSAMPTRSQDRVSLNAPTEDLGQQPQQPTPPSAEEPAAPVVDEQPAPITAPVEEAQVVQPTEEVPVPAQEPAPAQEEVINDAEVDQKSGNILPRPTPVNMPKTDPSVDDIKQTLTDAGKLNVDEKGDVVAKQNSGYPSMLFDDLEQISGDKSSALNEYLKIKQDDGPFKKKYGDWENSIMKVFGRAGNEYTVRKGEPKGANQNSFAWVSLDEKGNPIIRFNEKKVRRDHNFPKVKKEFFDQRVKKESGTSEQVNEYKELYDKTVNKLRDLKLHLIHQALITKMKGSVTIEDNINSLKEIERLNGIELAKDYYGEPMIFMHGGARGIKKFLKPGDPGYKRRDKLTGSAGLYFTRRPRFAKKYAEFEEEQPAAGKDVYYTFLRTKNPYYTTDPRAQAEYKISNSKTLTNEDVEALKKLGYDSIIWDRDQEGAKHEVIVFEPDQVEIIGSYREGLRVAEKESEVAKPEDHAPTTAQQPVTESDTLLGDALKEIRKDKAAFNLVRFAFQRGALPENKYNEFGRDLLAIKKEKGKKYAESVAEVIAKYVDSENIKDETEAIKKQAEENKAFDDRSNEGLTEDEIFEANVDDKLRLGQELTPEELQFANENMFRPEGYNFDPKGNLVKSKAAPVEKTLNKQRKTQAQATGSIGRVSKEYVNALVKRLTKAVKGVPVETDPTKVQDAYDNLRAKDPKLPAQLPVAFKYRNKIYISENALSDTPIHEFAHVWLDVIKHQVPALHKAGIELIHGTEYHKDVINSPAYTHLDTQQQHEEALAQAIGEDGVRLMDRSSFYKWLKDLWNKIKNAFGIRPAMDLNFMTLDEFTRLAAKDLLAGDPIIQLSSIEMPETAQYRMQHYKLPKESVEAFILRQEVVKMANSGKKTAATWRQNRTTLMGEWFSDLLTYFQDKDRRLKETQKRIVDSHIEDLIKQVDDQYIAGSIDKKQHDQKVKAIKAQSSGIAEKLISDGINVYGLRDVQVGKIKNQINEIRQKWLGKDTAETGYGRFFQFLTEKRDAFNNLKVDESSVAYKLEKEGLSLFDLGMYMYAKHAPVRNQSMRDRGMEGDSGMDDATAALFMQEFQDSGKIKILEDLAQEFRNDFIVAPLKMKLEEGLITQEQFDLIIDFYSDTYVPLHVRYKVDRGINEVRSIGVRGKGIPRIKGTFDHPWYTRVNPFVQGVLNFEQAISAIETNKTLQSLRAMVQEHPNPEVWSVVKPTYIPNVDLTKLKNAAFEDEALTDMLKDYWQVREALKNKTKDPDYTSKFWSYIQQTKDIKNDVMQKIETEMQNLVEAKVDENEKFGIPVMVDGKKEYVIIKDKKLLEVFKTRPANTNAFVNSAMRALQSIQSYFRLTLVGINPDFIIPNLTRDIQDALVNLSAAQVKGIRRKVAKNILPSMKAVYNYERNGNASSDLSKSYMDMQEQGGMIDWLNWGDAETQLEDIVKEINKYNFDEKKTAKYHATYGVPLNVIRAAFRFLMLTNKAVETSVRLATYHSLVQSGVSQQKAAVAAKNVTVNFNRKGTGTNILNALFLFANPGIQGTTRHLSTLVRSRKAQKVVVLFMLANIFNRMLWDMWDDEEDDKLKIKDLLLERDMEDYMNFYNPFNPKMPLKLPVSYNMKGWKTLSDEIYNVMKGEKDLMEATLHSFETFLESLYPMYSTSVAGVPVPNIAQPAVELKYNERLYNDTPIYKEKLFDISTKDSELYYNNTSDFSIAMTRYASGVLEGNDDVLEISPNTLDYTLGWISGGVGRQARTFEEFLGLFQGNSIDWNNVAIVRRFVNQFENQEWRYKVAYHKLYESGNQKKLTYESWQTWLNLGKKLIKTKQISADDFNRDKRKLNSVQIKDFKNHNRIPVAD